MREILFKAKTIEGGKWIEGLIFKHMDYGYYCIAESLICGSVFNSELAGKWDTVDENTICQFTGMTDKNGNKIFEGDICLCPYIDPIFLSPWTEENCEKCEIAFYSGAFIVKYEEKANVLLSQLSERIEVIGNIHNEE